MLDFVVIFSSSFFLLFTQFLQIYFNAGVLFLQISFAMYWYQGYLFFKFCICPNFIQFLQRLQCWSLIFENFFCYALVSRSPIFLILYILSFFAGLWVLEFFCFSPFVLLLIFLAYVLMSHNVAVICFLIAFLPFNFGKHSLPNSYMIQFLSFSFITDSCFDVSLFCPNQVFFGGGGFCYVSTVCVYYNDPSFGEGLH